MRVREEETMAEEYIEEPVREKNPRRFIKVVLIALIALIVLGAGTIVVALQLSKDIIKDPLSAFNEPGEKPAESGQTPVPGKVTEPGGTVAEELVEKGAHYNENLVTFALFGIDSDVDRNGKSMGYRSDTIVVCAVDMAENNATLITIPRDTKATVRHLGNNGEVTKEEENKINSAFSYAGGDKPRRYDNAMHAIEQLFARGGMEIPIDYYAGINMDGISDIADAIGGVTLTLRERVPGFGNKGETITLKGSRAEDYVRKRHGVTGGSDLGRARRQQDFLLGIAKKVKEMMATGGATEVIPKLFNQLNKSVDTNFTVDQLIAMGTVLSKTDFDNITFTFLEGTARYEDGKSYYFVDDEAMGKLLGEIFYVGGEADTTSADDEAAGEDAKADSDAGDTTATEQPELAENDGVSEFEVN